MSLEILRTLAAAMTIIAAAMVAANWNARITVCGFSLFIAASIAWIADGIIEPKNSLIIQNAVLLVINVLGVWRWLPRAGKEAAASMAADPRRGRVASGLLPVGDSPARKRGFSRFS